jgi:hypothetical protein
MKKSRLVTQVLLLFLIISNGGQICRTLIGYASKFFRENTPDPSSILAAAEQKMFSSTAAAAELFED